MVDRREADPVDILIVDDLPDKLMGFQAVLEQLGQNLVLVSSGADALRELLRREFAVILLDVNMPDIDGIETAEMIRQHPKTAHTPIIFVTAYADEMQTARGYELGAVDYILSPIVPQILRSKVRVFVDLFRAQRRARDAARAEADRAAAEEATRRSELVARASRELTSSLDVEQSARTFADLLVPMFAAHALVCLGRDDIALCVAANGEPPPELSALPARLNDALERSRAEARRTDLKLHGESASGWPAELGYATVLPMRVGEATIGAVILGSSAAGAGTDPTLLDLVDRAAIAIDNAQLYGNLKREMARAKEAEEKLQQANRRKDEFLAMLSHELRNPLAPIRSAAELMRRIAPSDPRIVWTGEVIERQVGHLAQLVDDLLDVARITQGKITLQAQPVELAKILSHSIETARPQIESRRHHLSVFVPETPICLRGDFTRLAQVFGNLLHNAAKFTPEGGKIEVRVSVQQGRAVVAIRDNGVGIDSKLLPYVFELFVQGARTSDRSQGGLGVGLTVVERIISLHNGRVEVSSDGAGKGTEFRVVLPCLSEAVTSSTTHEHDDALAGWPLARRILVIDDNTDAAETIAVFLRLEGHDVRTANDGAQALAYQQLFAPDAAVVDIGLPVMDGYELAQRLRRVNPDLLLVALTGYGQSDDRERCFSAGFDYHFVKPANPGHIVAAVKRPPSRAPRQGQDAADAG